MCRNKEEGRVKRFEAWMWEGEEVVKVMFVCAEERRKEVAGK